MSYNMCNILKLSIANLCILSLLVGSCKKKRVSKNVKRINQDQAGFFDLAGLDVCEQEVIIQASINHLWLNYSSLNNQEFRSRDDLINYYENFEFKPSDNKIELCPPDSGDCGDLISLTVGTNLTVYHPSISEQCLLPTYFHDYNRHKLILGGKDGFLPLTEQTEASAYINRLKKSIQGYSETGDCQVRPLNSPGEDTCDEQEINQAAFGYLWLDDESKAGKQFNSFSELQENYRAYNFQAGDEKIEMCSSTGDCSDLFTVRTLPHVDWFSGIKPKECEIFSYPNYTDAPKYLLIYEDSSFRVGDGSDISLNLRGIQQSIPGSSGKLCRVAPINTTVARNKPPTGVVDIKLIEERIDSFYQKVCQENKSCPQGRRLMQLYDFSSLKNHPDTGISEILNPFSAPRDKFDYRCILNRDEDIWMGYQELTSSDYQNHGSSCHRVVNENNQVKLNLTRPRSDSLFDKDKYQFEIDNSVYSTHQDLFNLDYIRIETPQADTIANSRLKVLSSQSPPFPSASLTGNYFILSMENFTVAEFQDYKNSKSESLRKGLIPAKSYLALKEEFIQDWLGDLRTYFTDTGGKQKPNPVSWCALASNVDKCFSINQEQINQWQVARNYVDSGYGYATTKIFSAENSFRSIKLGKVTMDVLDKSGQGDQRLLLINDCAYKPNRLREYFKAFYDQNHSFYGQLDDFIESQATLSERKRQHEIFGKITCNYSQTNQVCIKNLT